jgi:hypothetical protein
MGVNPSSFEGFKSTPVVTAAIQKSHALPAAAISKIHAQTRVQQSPNRRLVTNRCQQQQHHHH